MTIWLVGSRGLLGSTFVTLFEQRGIPFIGSTRKDVDLTNEEQIHRFYHQHLPSHIINCTGYTNVDLAESHPEKARRENVLGPQNLGKLGARHQIPVIHFSTDYVFDGQNSSPYKEDDICHPLSVYGKTKREGEERLLQQFPQACVIRSSALFSQHGKNFVGTILRLLQEKEVLDIVDDQISRPTYCPDLAEAALDLLDQSGIFHFANRGDISWYSFAEAIWEKAQDSELLLRTKEIRPIPSSQSGRAAPRPKYSSLSTEKFTKITGKTPRSWRDALKKC